MNTHRAHALATAKQSRSIVRAVVGLGMAALGWCVPGMASPPEKMRQLDRFVLSGDLAYQIRIVPDAKPPHNSFFVVPVAQQDVDFPPSELALVYRAAGDPRALPERWTWGETTLFIGQHVAFPGVPVVDVNRFSVSELVCLVRSDNPEEECPKRYHGRSAGYCNTTPVLEALTGLMSLTEEGYERTIPPRPHVVQYDIRAINDTVIELFLTVDQRLTKWVYDGQKWQHLRNYHINIEGEFLVCQDGQSLITAREGSWSIVDIEAKTPALKSIIERVPDQPLTVVEDIVKKQTYFEHQGNIFDRNGAKLWSMRSGLDKNAQAQAVVDFVRSKRGD